MVNYIHLDPYPLPSRNAELLRKEEALYLQYFTQELKIRKFCISCSAELKQDIVGKEAVHVE